MKIYRFHQQVRIALNPPPGLLVALRHGKIMINTLLRWCSAGLISSYILTITAGIYFSHPILRMAAQPDPYPPCITFRRFTLCAVPVF